MFYLWSEFYEWLISPMVTRSMSRKNWHLISMWSSVVFTLVWQAATFRNIVWIDQVIIHISLVLFIA
jgi:hypothetical protein